MKKILRWTIGNVSAEGFDCLKLSIKRMIEMYKREFEYFVCHNNLTKKEMTKIAGLGVNFMAQEDFTNCLPISPSNNFGVSWKLYPPRIDLNAYEIFMDNDVVLHKKIDFERYEDMFFISEALKRSYGSFDGRIEGPIAMNSGMFGLPPRFDFGLALSNTIVEFDVKWDDSYFEEQGLVAYVISKEPHFVLSRKDIGITFNNPSCFVGEYGTHFIGLNRGSNYYWKKYRTIF